MVQSQGNTPPSTQSQSEEGDTKAQSDQIHNTPDSDIPTTTEVPQPPPIQSIDLHITEEENEDATYKKARGMLFAHHTLRE